MIQAIVAGTVLLALAALTGLVAPLATTTGRAAPGAAASPAGSAPPPAQ